MMKWFAKQRQPNLQRKAGKLDRFRATLVIRQRERAVHVDAILNPSALIPGCSFETSSARPNLFHASHDGAFRSAVPSCLGIRRRFRRRSCRRSIADSIFLCTSVLGGVAHHEASNMVFSQRHTLLILIIG
ncbi:hypothetical protein ABZP36_010484 [Zizania latifolia]